jgi:hypothetical protein
MRETREPSRELNRSKVLPQVLLDLVPGVIESEQEPSCGYTEWHYRSHMA